METVLKFCYISITKAWAANFSKGVVNMFLQGNNSIASIESKFSLEVLSIKKITLLGFTLVTLPLVIALIYSATKVDQISKQATQVIFSVASLTTITNKLSENQQELEHLASQFIILKEIDLREAYINKEQEILQLININLAVYNDLTLTNLSQKYVDIVTKINNKVTQRTIGIDALTILKSNFIALAAITQKINRRSNVLINEQANQIEATAKKVSDTMLHSLAIIPIAIGIAGVFIILITKPLKLLIAEIQVLQQGDFEKEIESKGFPEVREITKALESMRVRLHALELQKSSFIRHISHELKTPLAAIREGTELLYDNSVGKLNDEQQEVCEIIKISVNRLQLLIEDLLDFNIVLDSTSLQDRESIALPALVNEVVGDHKLDIKRKQIDIKLELQKVIVYSNAKQLKVILENILSNAIKYSKAQGTIYIETRIVNKQLELVVIDNGVGISTKLKEKVFDAFYQGPAPEHEQIKGSGLGLTIVKELLMRLNGDIKIKNQGRGSYGTTVLITLPKVELVT